MTVSAPARALNLRSEEARSIMFSWYNALHSEHKKAERAQLRRLDSLADVMWHPEYYALLQLLEAQNVEVRRSNERGAQDEQALAALVSLLSHVKSHQRNLPIGRALRGGQSGKQGLSDLRFRRLLATQNVEELLPHARRALHILDGTIDVVELCRMVSSWRPNAEYSSQLANPRMRLAEEFYTAGN